MLGLFDFYMAHPFWVWLAVAAVFLSVEVATGTGWLLWPVGSAIATGLLTLIFRPGIGIEIAVFAALTMISTLVAWRFFPPGRVAESDDINDQNARLIGRKGLVVEAFDMGHGRVLVGGAEWPAEADRNLVLIIGTEIQVEAVLDGARLSVRGI
jgi:membrane protein implicated in regulation of membrane protease activity